MLAPLSNDDLLLPVDSALSKDSAAAKDSSFVVREDEFVILMLSSYLLFCAFCGRMGVLDASHHRGAISHSIHPPQTSSGNRCEIMIGMEDGRVAYFVDENFVTAENPAGAHV